MYKVKILTQQLAYGDLADTENGLGRTLHQSDGRRHGDALRLTFYGKYMINISLSLYFSLCFHPLSLSHFPSSMVVNIVTLFD